MMFISFQLLYWRSGGVNQCDMRQASLSKAWLKAINDLAEHAEVSKATKAFHEVLVTWI